MFFETNKCQLLFMPMWPLEPTKKKTKIIRFINCSDFASDKNDSSFAINKSNSAIK